MSPKSRRTKGQLQAAKKPATTFPQSANPTPNSVNYSQHRSLTVNMPSMFNDAAQLAVLDDKRPGFLDAILEQLVLDSEMEREVIAQEMLHRHAKERNDARHNRRLDYVSMNRLMWFGGAFVGVAVLMAGLGMAKEAAAVMVAMIASAFAAVWFRGHPVPRNDKRVEIENRPEPEK